MFQSIKSNRGRKGVSFIKKSQQKASRRAVLNWDLGLETRVLLALTLGNLDALNAFGTDAENAKLDLQQAVNYWNSYLNINTPFPINVLVDMDPKLDGGAHASSTATISYGGRTRPSAGEITINYAGGNQYFFDPTPSMNEEFKDISSPFVATWTSAAAAGVGDFLSLTMHELGHAIGFNQKWLSPNGVNYNNPYTIDTGKVYPQKFSDGSSATYWAYNSPTVQTLLTNFNSGSKSVAADYTGPTHSAQDGTQTNFAFNGVNYYTSEDIMNPYYSTGQRTLISYNDANIISESVGWGLGSSPIANLLINLDSDGNLTANGDDSNNLITVDTSGAGQVELVVTTQVYGVLPNNMATADFPVGVIKSLSVNAGRGDDHVELAQFQSPLSLIPNVDGGSGNDLIQGSPMNDSINGSFGDDTIYGNNGDDKIDGNYGNDVMIVGIGNSTISDKLGNNLYDWRLNLKPVNLTAGDGNDTIYGTNFSDQLSGGDGADTIYGYGGSDTLIGGQGGDRLFGGDDSDLFLWSAGDGWDAIDGGSGTDETDFSGSIASDIFKLSFAATAATIDVDASGALGVDSSVAFDVEHVLFAGLGGADAYIIDTLTTTPVKLVDIVMGGDGSANIATVKLPNLGTNVNATPSAASFASVDVNNLSAMVTISNSSPLDTLDIIGGYGHDQIEIPAETLALISVQADGMGGNDLIRGAQTAMGGSGDDTIFGTDGNDVLLGGLGNDRIEGLAGNDLILGDGTATGVAAGVPGNNGPGIPGFAIDAYSPTGGNDFILGGEGADSINGGAGNDSIEGGDGADTIGVIIAALNPLLPGDFLEPGNDLITGGLGDDSIQAGDGNDVVFGNEGQDLISGQAGNDTIDGGTGNDTIFGNEDNDSILGGDGKDSIDGGAGDDYIAGNNDDDSILGAAGADTIDGGDGADILFGNDGSDSILGGDGNDTIDGGTGDDSIAGNADEDSIMGGDGNDTIDGGEGNDVILGNAGDDSISGGLGLDSIHGGLGADLVNGDEGNDSLCGGPDDSEKVDPAQDGSDTIFSGAGNDAVSGDAGDDFLNGGDGNDQLWGGDGNDTIGVFVYNGQTQFDPGNDSMVGGAGDDFIAGALVDSAGKPVSDGNDVMFGQAGNDTMWGGAGGDMIYGGEGDDVMLGGTPLTANTLHAPRDPKLPNDGNDTMFGGNGFDKMDGGNNNNLLDAGNDGIRETVLGGLGNDMGYRHFLQDPVNYDILALDGGFNHKFCDGGLEEPPAPAASCTYIDWVIPVNYYTGVKMLKNGDIVEHPSLDYRTKPNNGPNGPVSKPGKVGQAKAVSNTKVPGSPSGTKPTVLFAGKANTVGQVAGSMSKTKVIKS